MSVMYFVEYGEYRQAFHDLVDASETMIDALANGYDVFAYPMIDPTEDDLDNWQVLEEGCGTMFYENNDEEDEAP